MIRYYIDYAKSKTEHTPVRPFVVRAVRLGVASPLRKAAEDLPEVPQPVLGRGEDEGMMLRREGRKAAAKERIGWGVATAECWVCGRQFPWVSRHGGHGNICEECMRRGLKAPKKKPKPRPRPLRRKGERIFSFGPGFITFMGANGRKRTVHVEQSPRMKQFGGDTLSPEAKARLLARYRELFGEMGNI